MKTIHITTGDSSGIGPEITWAALQKVSCKNYIQIYHEKKPPLNFGTWVDISFKNKYVIYDLQSDKKIHEGTYRPKFFTDYNSGLPGLLVARKIEVASLLIQKSPEIKSQALVTSPIHKERLITQSNCKFGGHTEYLGALFKQKKIVMCLKNSHFSVSLLTIHIPLKKVISEIKKINLKKHMEFTKQELTKFGISGFSCRLQPMPCPTNLFTIPIPFASACFCTARETSLNLLPGFAAAAPSSRHSAVTCKSFAALSEIFPTGKVLAASP